MHKKGLFTIFITLGTIFISPLSMGEDSQFTLNLFNLQQGSSQGIQKILETLEILEGRPSGPVLDERSGLTLEELLKGLGSLFYQCGEDLSLIETIFPFYISDTMSESERKDALRPTIETLLKLIWSVAEAYKGLHRVDVNSTFTYDTQRNLYRLFRNLKRHIRSCYNNIAIQLSILNSLWLVPPPPKLNPGIPMV